MDIESITDHFEKLAVPMAVANPDGKMIEVNHAFCEYLGYSRQELLNMSVFDYTHPADMKQTTELFDQVSRKKIDRFFYEKRYLRKNGETVWATVTTSWIPANGSNPALCVAVIQDITPRVRAQTELEKSEELHRTLLDHVDLGIALIDENHTILKLNPAMAGMFRKAPLDFIGKRCFREFEKRDRVCEHCPGFRTLKDGKHHVIETEGVRDDGTRFMVKIHAAPVLDPDGRVRSFIEVVEDITQKRALESQVEQSQDQLNYLAHHDQLTGLPNRTLFYDRLKQAIDRAKKQKESIAVIFFDVDRFRKINQSLGFSAGNQVLEQIVQRLGSHLFNTDSLCRMGGTEFALVLEKNGNPQRSTKVAGSILSSFRQKPFVVDGHKLHITASIGISHFPDDGDNVDSLLSAAEKARGRTKEKGGDGYQYFQPEMEKDSRQFLELENQLHAAIESDQLMPYYQPQVNPASGRVIGMEALARWKHPDNGFVSPGEFIPLAEQTGLIVALGRGMLEDACLQARQWLDSGLLGFRVSVNVSALQFVRGQLVKTVRTALRKTGLPSVYLEVEITESVLMSDPELALNTLNELRAMGVSVALDDFGTGYSALSYLKDFPVNRLKIDQKFIRNVPFSSHDASIVEAIFAMGKKLGIEVIAEGVETVDHLRCLLDLGCDQIQGYYFSRPHDAETLTECLKEWLGPGRACPLKV